MADVIRMLFGHLLIFLTLSAAIAAEQPFTQTPSGAVQEPVNSGWAFHMDNDLIASSGNDQDYTGGIALTLSGTRAQRYWWSPAGFRQRIERWLGIDQHLVNGGFKLHAAEAGFALFTPRDLTIEEPQVNDHPYASLFFVVSNAQFVLPAQRLSLSSTLTIGVLGLSAGGEVQSGIHSVIGATQPRGWSNQISAGGEPTLRYTLGAHKTLLNLRSESRPDVEISASAEMNLGFTTDINSGVNIRLGRLATPWWGFNPHQAEYVNLGSAVPLGNLTDQGGEFFIYMGGNAKFRIYNALLQGQFRDSEVSFDRSELSDVIYELWAGASFELPSRLKFTLFMRGRSAEINIAKGREPVWGGLIVSRSY